MSDFTLKKGDASLHAELAALWERSVRATHHFVTEEDIVFFRSAVRDGLAVLDVHYVECDGRPAAFVAVGGDKVEMLFVDPEFFGLGARGFYEHLGFKTVSRDETDDSGKEYPVLHLALTYGL